MRRRRFTGFTSALAISALAMGALLLPGCTGAPSTTSPIAHGEPNGDAHFPVEIINCGRALTFEQAPSRAITLNQGATEVLLALRLQELLHGTAYLDDAVDPRWQAEYDDIPVLATEYPSREAFLAARPDFAYASYASAFDAKTIGTRDELRDDGIGTYVSAFACPEETRAKPSFDAVWTEFADIAAIFGVPERAESLIASQRQQLVTLIAQRVGHGMRVLWFDSGDNAPLVGAGGGGPQQIMEAVGATNIFADITGNWAEVGWEKVLAADPDVIVLVDSSSSPADQKRAQLKKDPVTRQLRAVREGSYVVIPFSESTPGVRLIDGAKLLATGLSDARKH